MAIFGGVIGNLAADVRNMVNGGIQAAESAKASAQSQVNMANSALGTAKGAVANAMNSAANMQPYITNTANAANDVAKTAGSMDSYAANLRAYAQTLGESGDYLRGQGTGLFGQAGDLLSLNPAAGGIVGKLIGNINQFDPEKYVSRAASDVQASFQNAAGQTERDLARRGVSATSGAYAATKAAQTRTLAAMLAGAKTNAWSKGLAEQNTILQNALTQALAMRKEATDETSAGNSATSAAAGAEKSAADVVAAKGDLQYKSGALYDSAGKLVATQGSLYADAANASTGIANAFTNGAKVMTDAGQLLVNAYGAGLDAAHKMAGAGGGGGGGVNVTSAPSGNDDDFHQTYIKNGGGSKDTSYKPQYSNPNATYYN